MVLFNRAYTFPLFKCIINYVLSLNMPKMKCAGGGDSKYELSSALLVHVIKMSAFKSAMES